MTPPRPLRDDAADRSKVGNTTLDRNFPHRSGLIAAVLDEASDVLEARASDLADQPGEPVDPIEDMAFIQEQAGGLVARDRTDG